MEAIKAASHEHAVLVLDPSAIMANGNWPELLRGSCKQRNWFKPTPRSEYEALMVTLFNMAPIAFNKATQTKMELKMQNFLGYGLTFYIRMVFYNILS